MKRAANLNQLGFSFDPPAPAREAADLAGLDRMIAAAVARILKDDPRSRDEIAGAMTALLDSRVTRFNLDAYASEARETFNISMARFLSLVAATDRFDLLDRTLRRVGVSVLVGEEIVHADISDLECRIGAMTRLLKSKKALVAPMTRGRD